MTEEDLEKKFYEEKEKEPQYESNEDLRQQFEAWKKSSFQQYDQK